MSGAKKAFMRRFLRACCARRAMIPMLAALSATAPLFSAGSASAQMAFYQASQAEIAGAPGTIIRQEPMMPTASGGAAYRVLYRSTGLHNEPIAVSGVVISRRDRRPPAAAMSWPGPIRQPASCRVARRRWRCSSSSRSKVCGK
jgi:hypothetical protein